MGVSMLKSRGGNWARGLWIAKMREIVWERANMAALWLNFGFLRWAKTLESVPTGLKRQIRLHLQQLDSIQKLSKPA